MSEKMSREELAKFLRSITVTMLELVSAREKDPTCPPENLEKLKAAKLKFIDRLEKIDNGTFFDEFENAEEDDEGKSEK